MLAARPTPTSAWRSSCAFFPISASNSPTATDRKLHVTRQLLWEEYRQTHPDGYGKSQFYDHLKQNLVAQKDVTTVLATTYKPGEKLMVDFAGDKLQYVDPETGEVVRAEVFVGCMPYSDYIFVWCVPSQRTEDFLFALRMCLEHLGGVPPIVTPDNLKAAVIKPDRHEPTLNAALRPPEDPPAAS